MKTMKKIAASAFVVSAGMGFLTQSAWALLPIEHWTQPSGAQVWLVQSPGIPMVDVQMDFDAGSRRNPEGQAGLAAAVAMMTSKGIKAAGDAPALDENALGQAWADLGASFGANAGRDSFTFGLRTLTVPDLQQKAVSLAARQIAAPGWPDAVWQRDRERWSASIKESDTRPGTQASKALRKGVFGNSPYGYQTTVDSLAKIDISAMQAFHSTLIKACRAKVSVVGAVSREQADAMVKQLLGPLQATNGNDCAPLPEVAKVPDLTEAKVENIAFESAQAQVLIGQPGIARSSPDFLAVMVGNHILGGGGFTSRLMEEVREKRGLTYGVSSDYSPGLDRGAFTISLKTRPDQAAEALKVSQDVLRKFITEGPTDKELKAAKDNLVGGFALRIDSNRKLLGNVSNIAWNGLPLDYLEHWTDRVQALTTKDVKEAMQRMVQPDRMVTITLGAKP
ncbi:insulinase family protein [Comamonas sp. Y33R10-2]|uniref:M16 family metallopeptidase n=1 Tax=Comamonas sp. Y33R10-2 TaxID=2853257 RepID=UPI001C5CB02E|nr:pitrilysin family protein [Comamonas sp. Y33R10-2]QXZ09526.1 insulinase family protein [Comamonas sp. Y33R10-2]